VRRFPVNEKQANALALLLSSMPARFDFDALGNPGQEGPLLVDFDTLAVRVEETGICTLVEADFVGSVQ
jgi:hypothetical protein